MAFASEKRLRSEQVLEPPAEDAGAPATEQLQGASRSFRMPFWLRLGLSASVLGYLLWRTDLGQLGNLLLSASGIWLLAAIGIQLLGKLIWSVRWSALLHAFGQQVPLWRLMRAIYIGQFFNNFLPTSIGGDLYRGYWILDRSEEYQRSMFIIFLERFIGMVTMGYIALPALALLLLMSGQRVEGEILAIALLLIALCASVAALHPSIFRIVDRTLNRLSISWFASTRMKILQALVSLQQAGKDGIWIYASSIAVQFVGIGFYFALGNAIGLELVPWHYLVLVPLVTAATMLPISVNGMGVREGSLILITRALGVDISLDEALALGLLASLFIPLISLIGGWFYIRGRDKDGRVGRIPEPR